jgi:hypothetical protein
VRGPSRVAAVGERGDPKLSLSASAFAFVAVEAEATVDLLSTFRVELARRTIGRA